MKPHRLTISLVLFITAHAFAADAPEAQATVARITAAAKNLLGTLEETQRKKVQFDANDNEQKKKWSNFPTGIFKRAGLRMGDLSETQRAAVWALLKDALSPSGYRKVHEIVEADETLRKQEGGPRLMFGKDEYYVSFIGEPSEKEKWIIQFGGHHLGLNITMAGGRGTLAPSHTGAQPAIYEFEGKTVRPLGAENDKAFALLNSLDDAQRKQAILGVQMQDLVLGPGRDGQTIQPEGVKGAALTDKQRDMLIDLISEWIGIQDESIAKIKVAEAKKNIEETWFAWAGPAEKDSAAYFRIQGPTVIIEYAPQRMGGDAKKHIHTIYRDPTNEYGAGFTKP